MANVPPPGSPNLPKISEKKPLPESTVGMQVESSGSLTGKVEAKLWFKIPIFRWIESKLVRRDVKKTYVNDLRTKFINQARVQNVHDQAAAIIFDKYIAPKLLNTHLEDLPNFESLIQANGIKLLGEAFRSPKDGGLGVKGALELFDSAMNAMKKNPTGAARVIKSFPNLLKTAGNRGDALNLTRQFLMSCSRAKDPKTFNGIMTSLEKLLAISTKSEPITYEEYVWLADAKQEIPHKQFTEKTIASLSKRYKNELLVTIKNKVVENGASEEKFNQIIALQLEKLNPIHLHYVLEDNISLLQQTLSFSERAEARNPGSTEKILSVHHLGVVFSPTSPSPEEYFLGLNHFFEAAEKTDPEIFNIAIDNGREFFIQANEIENAEKFKSFQLLLPSIITNLPFLKETVEKVTPQVEQRLIRESATQLGMQFVAQAKQRGYSEEMAQEKFDTLKIGFLTGDFKIEDMAAFANFFQIPVAVDLIFQLPPSTYATSFNAANLLKKLTALGHPIQEAHPANLLDQVSQIYLRMAKLNAFPNSQDHLSYLTSMLQLINQTQPEELQKIFKDLESFLNTSERGAQGYDKSSYLNLSEKTRSLFQAPILRQTINNVKNAVREQVDPPSDRERFEYALERDGIRNSQDIYNILFSSPIGSPEDLKKFSEFLKIPNSGEVLARIAAVAQKNPQSAKAFLGRITQISAGEIQKNRGTYAEALANVSGASYLLEGRYSDEDHIELRIEMLELVAQTAEFPNLIQDINTIFDHALSIQSERPLLYTALQKILFRSTAIDTANALTETNIEFPFLSNTVQEIIESTVISNSQSLHENLGVFFMPMIYNNRNVPILRGLFNHSFTLHRDFKVPFQLLEDSDAIIDFSAYSDLYITNPKTMETQNLHLKLPFEGEMSQTEARKLLMVLKGLVEGKDFDTLYSKFNLDPLMKEERKIAFLEWREKSETKLAQMIYDFNATPTRPPFSFAREVPEIEQALNDPKNTQKALVAASAKYLFKVDEKLSLLPPEIASNHPEIAFIPPNEMRQAIDNLKSHGDKSFAMTLTKNRVAEVHIQPQDITLKDGSLMVKLDITFESQGKRHTRTTFYQRENKEDVKKIDEILASGLFARDLQLAKAEFLSEHVK